MAFSQCFKAKQIVMSKKPGSNVSLGPVQKMRRGQTRAHGLPGHKVFATAEQA